MPASVFQNQSTDHTLEDWDMLYDILVKGQFLVSKMGVEIMRKQDLGGDIVNIVSKNSLLQVQIMQVMDLQKQHRHILRGLLAAELGADKIRVNTVNPDAVISDQ